ncbi:MAG: cytochrome c biogenesis protein CcdA [Coriobacteriales bacterium]|jgi:cytochrome c-type biogenesis protein|nr:cytochrome c biogenesis protein CcdA [Coriobacteriales bacterium]
MQYVLVFLEGVIAFISPCLLPLLPAYLSFFAAGKADTRATLVNALGFVLGFSLVFVLLGAFAGTLGKFLVEYGFPIGVVAGCIVIVFGLNFLGVIKIGFLNRTIGRQADTRNLNLFSSILFGIVFSIGWTPCVGAFLGSALMLASQQGSVMVGAFMLLVFSLGLGIPFIASALLIDQIKGAFDFIKRNYKIINIISGVLLIVVGLLMVTGLMDRVIHALAV